MQIALRPLGDLPSDFALWRNIRGISGTHYIVSAEWEEVSRTAGSLPHALILGRIQIGDAPQYDLAALLAMEITPAPASHWLQTDAATLAQIQAAATALGGFTAPGYLAATEAARISAETAAAAAQISALTLENWAALVPLTGISEGSGAEVLDTDPGSHSDPITGTTVANAGRYRSGRHTKTASPAGSALQRPGSRIGCPPKAPAR